MEVRYQINDGESSQYAHAHLKPDDLRTNDYCIYLGGDLGEQDRINKDHPNYLKDKRILRYPSVGSFLESFCVGLITHEFIHLIIFELTHSMLAVRDFDSVDVKDQISAPDFWGSEL